MEVVRLLDEVIIIIIIIIIIIFIIITWMSSRPRKMKMMQSLTEARVLMAYLTVV